MENVEEKILNNIDSMKNEIIGFLQELVKIPSEVPPGKYRPISKSVAAKMKELGLNTKVKRNNVIGEVGNDNGPILIFNAHLDTVLTSDGWTKDPYGGEIIENKIYGRGAADDKSCVVAELFATKALLNAGIDINGKLILTAVVNEEISGVGGTEYIVNEEIINGDACLIGDVSCDYPIAFQGGTLQVRFTIKGIRRNAQAYPDLPPPNRNKYSGINAIAKMVPIINFLMELQEELKEIETKYPLPPDLPLKISSINMTVINGGNWMNAIPDNCDLHCLISCIPETDLENIRNRILDFVEGMKKEDPDLDITVRIPVFVEPHITDINTNFAKIVKRAFKSVFKEDREFKTFIPTTDAQLFQQKGIETILIGPLRGENNYHAQDEFVYIEDVINVTKIFAITALNYLK